MTEKMGTKINEIAYHRNGVSGDGFFVINFEYYKQRMVGVVFPGIGQCACAVFDLDLLNQGVIGFAENSWRGDQFYPELMDAINKKVDTVIKN
jgi:hypothetical protein